MARVLGIGDGLFVVLFFWVLCLFLCIIFSRAQSNFAKLGPFMIIFAGLLTIILVFIPREPQVPSVNDNIIIYDYTVVYRSALIAVLAFFILLGLALLTSMHFAVPVYAKPLRKITLQ